MIKIISISIVAFIVVFLLYTFIMLPTFTQRSKSSKLPQPYAWLYGIMTKIPFLANWVHGMEIDLGLIYGNRYKGKVYCCVYTAVIPLLTAILDLLFIAFIDIWYYAAAGVVFGTFYPLLVVSNMIKKQAESKRVAMIKYYEACERYFNDKLQVSEAFLRCKESAGGPIKQIFSDFNATYYVDKLKAYEEFVGTVGDIYSRSFATTVLAYDEDGADPCRTLQGMIPMATRDYHLRRMSRGKVKQYKMLSLVVIGIALLFANSSIVLGNVQGVAKDTGSIFTYLSILISMFVMLVCEFYDMR